MRNEAIYMVNREKNVCTAIICDCELDALNEFYKQTQFDIALKRPDLFLMDDKYVGKAKCNPADEFDERIGVNIAFQRAYAKYLRHKKKTLADIAKYVNRRVDIINTFVADNKKYNTV